MQQGENLQVCSYSYTWKDIYKMSTLFFLNLKNQKTRIWNKIINWNLKKYQQNEENNISKKENLEGKKKTF
jgi:hypothetical protein